MKELLAALSELSETGLIFTMPNADTESRELFRQIQDFCEKHPQAKAYTSLGQLRYLSCMRHVDGVVGNSSSGLLEVPSFKKGTINIGDRQKGRLKAQSIIDCEPIRSSISNAIEKMFSPQFQNQLSTVKNPYGDSGASEAIVKILESCSMKDILKKRFHDISVFFDEVI
jgi:GDP/UDP-N,N'-diacetylbacillosamine 2-epimerase (hydrolysing)